MHINLTIGYFFLKYHHTSESSLIEITDKNQPNTILFSNQENFNECLQFFFLKEFTVQQNGFGGLVNGNKMSKKIERSM